MKHDQKCRALKMVSASLKNAIATNAPQAGGEVALSEIQIGSALSCVKTVLNDQDASDAALSPVDIAQLVLEILQLILSHLPGGSTSGPTPAPTPTPAPAPTATPAPAPAIDTTGILDIAETIMEILELILSKLPQSGGSTTPASAPAPGHAVGEKNSISPVDIASIILAVLQLLLSRFGTPAPTKSASSKDSSLATASNASRPSPRTPPPGTQYVYDNLGRLQEIQFATGQTLTYSYDEAGNRESIVTA
jgi:YD repeat-containing protein